MLILLINESFNETNYDSFFVFFPINQSKLISDRPFVFAENLNNSCVQSNISMNTMDSQKRRND